LLLDDLKKVCLRRESSGQLSNGSRRVRDRSGSDDNCDGREFIGHAGEVLAAVDRIGGGFVPRLVEESREPRSTHANCGSCKVLVDELHATATVP
jgi:hypothetical protein